MDFILEAAQDGGPSRAHLIELNARVTPSVVRALGAGRDPVKALRSAFPGTAPDAGPASGVRQPNGLVLTSIQAVVENATAPAAIAPSQVS